MLSSKIIPFVTVALLGLTNASPISHAERAAAILKRYNTVINCDNDLPTKDPDNDLNTQADLIGRASADMAVLANFAFTELDVTGRGAGSPAFQHYFLPDDLDPVKRLFSAVAENNDPTNSPYDFIMNCQPVSQCTDTVYAVTNHRPESGGPRTMTICPAFFNAPWANAGHLLPTDKGNADQQTRWCESDDDDAKTMSYRKFVTPGSTHPSILAGDSQC